jgi:hypothetical protein
VFLNHSKTVMADLNPIQGMDVWRQPSVQFRAERWPKKLISVKISVYKSSN